MYHTAVVLRHVVLWLKELLLLLMYELLGLILEAVVWFIELLLLLMYGLLGIFLEQNHDQIPWIWIILKKLQITYKSADPGAWKRNMCHTLLKYYLNCIVKLLSLFINPILVGGGSVLWQKFEGTYFLRPLCKFPFIYDEFPPSFLLLHFWHFLKDLDHFYWFNTDRAQCDPLATL